MASIKRVLRTLLEYHKEQYTITTYVLIWRYINPAPRFLSYRVDKTLRNRVHVSPCLYFVAFPADHHHIILKTWRRTRLFCWSGSFIVDLYYELRVFVLYHYQLSNTNKNNYFPKFYKHCKIKFSSITKCTFLEVINRVID